LLCLAELCSAFEFNSAKEVAIDRPGEYLACVSTLTKVQSQKVAQKAVGKPIVPMGLSTLKSNRVVKKKPFKLDEFTKEDIEFHISVARAFDKLALQ
jgi:hypothetical protein